MPAELEPAAFLVAAGVELAVFLDYYTTIKHSINHQHYDSDICLTISAPCAWLSCSNLYCTILILVYGFWAN